jgi:hypothetical protein
VVITYHCVETSTTDVSLAIGTNSYTWNGTTYTAGGTYTFTGDTASNGCDSVAILNLTIPTGTGIVAHCNDVYNFTPTTVDSTTYYDLILTNTVGVSQTVSFNGLVSPFLLSSSTVIIDANSSDTVELRFRPLSVGDYTDTLNWTGSIFGGGTIAFNGEGVQVSIAVDVNTLTLDTVALGSSVSDDIWLFNTGTGTMVVSDITSDDSTVSVSPTTFNIDEGDSTTINITHTPVLAGNMNATITIFSNDPNNPTYDVSIIGNAISELSDSVCGTLTLINSPYSFVNDILVPLGCTLTIEPGVLVNGNGYNLTVDGQLNCIGTSSDSIRLRNITTITLGNDSLGNHQIAYTILEGGIFFDDFQVDDYLDKWTGNTSYMDRSTSYGNPTSGYGMQFWAVDIDEEFISNSFIITEEGKCNISWDYKVVTTTIRCYNFIIPTYITFTLLSNYK